MLMCRVLALLLCGVCCSINAAWGDAPSIDTPDVHAGDMWKYRILDGFTNEETDQISSRVVEMTDTEILTQEEWTKGKSKVLQIFDRQWNFKDNGRGRWVPLRPEFKFPLSVGSNWSQTFQYSDFKTGATFSGLANVRVLGSEQVTVPAGTYYSIITDMEIELRSGDTDANEIKNSFKVWYAPAVNRAVRIEWQTFSNGRIRGKTITQLIEYVPEKTHKAHKAGL